MSEVKKFQEINISLRKEVAELREIVKSKTAAITELKTNFEDVEDRLDEYEQYSRRNTLRVSGVPEEPNESIDGKILPIFNTRLSLDPPMIIDDIDRIHRVSKPDQRRDPRQVLVKFATYRCRQRVKMSWSCHIQHTRKKISKGIGILYKAKRLLTQETLITLYNSFIYPYIVYCIEVWGSTCKNNLLSLLKLQKCAIRLITSSPRGTESAPLFESLNILSVFQVYLLKLSILCLSMQMTMFRIILKICFASIVRFTIMILDNVINFICQRATYLSCYIAGYIDV